MWQLGSMVAQGVGMMSYFRVIRFDAEFMWLSLWHMFQLMFLPPPKDMMVGELVTMAPMGPRNPSVCEFEKKKKSSPLEKKTFLKIDVPLKVLSFVYFVH